MNAKTVSIEIPAPPDGYEAFCAITPSKSELYFSYVKKMWLEVEPNKEGHQGVVARRKPTLADWANDHPLFKALAEILKFYSERRNELLMQEGTRDHGQWTFRDRGDVVFYPALGTPPANLTGSLKLENGKWVDL